MSCFSRLPHTIRPLVLVFAILLVTACEQKEPEQPVEQADPGASTAHESTPEVTSIDADGNVAPFGMVSRQAVRVEEPLPAAPPVPTAATSGLYGIHCVACHGADANGVEGLGVSLLVSELVARSDEDGIVAFLQVGRLPQAEDSITGVPMPAFSWMEPEQLDELAAYLKSLQQP
ncbi:MAG: cytochrome c [Gammaproteobacteria bacterium]|nr:cytochrome c [Gammaproteobacteria bacterium]MDP7093553.1 cytochrome c [Gammaproteobacteria bacterium]MDP7271607.1 cytochrome c [Gammaproteobacteria bacterium]HJP05595.1 cytochrome c [Gammaproteobacteria bacterium]